MRRSFSCACADTSPIGCHTGTWWGCSPSAAFRWRIRRSSEGKTVDLLLRPDRGIAAAQSLLRKALVSTLPRVPRKVTIDGHVPSRRALWLLHFDGQVQVICQHSDHPGGYRTGTPCSQAAIQTHGSSKPSANETAAAASLILRALWRTRGGRSGVTHKEKSAEKRARFRLDHAVTADEVEAPEGERGEPFERFPFPAVD